MALEPPPWYPNEHEYVFDKQRDATGHVPILSCKWHPGTGAIRDFHVYSRPVICPKDVYHIAKIEEMQFSGYTTS